MNPADKTSKREKGKSAAVDWDELRSRLSALTKQDAEHGEMSRSRKDEILRERAATLARPVATEGVAKESVDLVRFRLGVETYAMETRYIREVIPAPRIFSVPQAGDVLLGVMNLRGEVLAVMEPRRIFGVSLGAAEHRTVLVVGEGRAEFGIVVDEALEVARVATREIVDPPDSGSAPGREYIRGMTGDGTIIVNGSMLLADERLYLDQSEEG